MLREPSRLSDDDFAVKVRSEAILGELDSQVRNFGGAEESVNARVKK